MYEHCKGCIRYLKSCSGLSKELCEKHKLRLPRTNADRIRSMTNEELAEWIADDLIEPGYNIGEQTVKMWLDWLRQECANG